MTYQFYDSYNGRVTRFYDGPMYLHDSGNNIIARCEKMMEAGNIDAWKLTGKDSKLVRTQIVLMWLAMGVIHITLVLGDTSIGSHTT